MLRYVRASPGRLPALLEWAGGAARVRRQDPTHRNLNRNQVHKDDPKSDPTYDPKSGPKSDPNVPLNVGNLIGGQGHT